MENLVPSATQIRHRRGPQMAPAQKHQLSDNSGVILEKILEVKKLVDESLKLSRENGEDIRKLRTELGVDGSHGRLPQLERSMVRLDSQQESDHKEVLALLAESQKKNHDDKNKIITRIESLEYGDHLARGKKQAATVAISIVCSSGFATLVVWLLSHMGIIH